MLNNSIFILYWSHNLIYCFQSHAQYSRLNLSFYNFLGEKLRNPDEVLLIELGCMKSLKQWDEIAVKVADLLPSQPDHWSYIKLYITAQMNRAVAIRDGVKCDGENESASTSWLSPVYEMKLVLDHLLDKEKEKSSHRFRGPYLAQLELLDQMTHHKISVQDDKCKNG